MNTESLINPETKIKVSSTLDKSVAKKYLVDGNPETCWTSQQGTPQYIQLSSPSPVIPKRISITFQGGFAGRCCTILINNTSPGWNTLTRIYPEDVNRAQVFDLEADGVSVKEGTSELRIVFEESSDFFGRITVYDLGIEGCYP